VGLILDTSALIAWKRAMAEGRSASISLDEPIALPVVVWAEALIGVRMADMAIRAAQRRSRLEALRRMLEMQPFTSDIAEHYANIYAELTQAGAMIPQNDIARSLRFGVLVGPKDEIHFRKVAGLDVRVLTSA
jgi:predicted nucleic acid-binding protein